MERVEKVAVLDNEVQARLIDSVLTDRGIPHVLRSYHDSVYDGLFQTGLGWGHIEAPPSLRQEVLDVIEEIKRQAGLPRPEGAGGEEDEPGAR